MSDLVDEQPPVIAKGDRVESSPARMAPSGVALLVPQALLEGDFEEAPLEVVAGRLDACERGLAAHDAAVDILVGRCMNLIVDDHGIEQLSHSRQQDFVELRCDFSYAQGRELMGIEEALRQLPVLDMVFRAGVLGRSKVRAIVKVATPETERGWIALARRRGLRGLEDAMRAYRAGLREAPDDPAERTTSIDVSPDEDDRVRVRWKAKPADAAAWRFGCEMMRTVLGEDAPVWKCADALAGDTLARLDVPPAKDAEATATSADTSACARRPAHERIDDARLVELGRQSHHDLALPRLPALPDPDAAVGVFGVLAVLRKLLAMRRSIDFQRSRLLFWIHSRRLYTHLGYRTCDAYVERGLGKPPRDVSFAVWLQGVMLQFPDIAAAWRDGLISERMAFLLSQVVTLATQRPWLDHVVRMANRLPGRCGVKRLEIEVAWHLGQRALLTHDEYIKKTGGVPVRGLALREMFANWQDFFNSRTREAQASKSGACDVSPDPNVVVDIEEAEAAAPSLARELTVSFSAPPDVAGVWRQAVSGISDAAGGLLDEGECVHAMVILVAHDHGADTVKRAKVLRDVLERDGWRCSSPLCRSRRNLHVHHIRFRSRGGGDEPANLTTLCAGCHGLLHDGFLAIEGEAPDRLAFLVRPSDHGPPFERWEDGMLVHAADA